MRKFNDFSPELIKKIQFHIDLYLSQVEPPHYAAFDADGTLWNIDAGEAFFKYQIRNSNLKDLPSDPWHHYHSWKEQNPREAYLWLAQINANEKLSSVRHWGRGCLEQNRDWPVYSAQRQLIQWLRLKGIRVFIVTASIKWAVEPFAELMGLHYDDVIGVETEVRDGIVSSQQRGPITWREGKPEALLERTQGVNPCLCVGNTMGDAALLESSAAVRLAVRCSKFGDELYATENELREWAEKRGWFTHSF